MDRLPINVSMLTQSQRMKSPLACLLLMAAFLANSRDAAAQSTYGFKEKFDGLHGYFTTGPYAYFPGDTIWANSWGWTLLSYLRLYETTGDQAFLIRFAEHASGLIAKKHTWTNIVYSGLPLWTVDLTDDQWLHY